MVAARRVLDECSLAYRNRLIEATRYELQQSEEAAQ